MCHTYPSKRIYFMNVRAPLKVPVQEKPEDTLPRL